MDTLFVEIVQFKMPIAVFAPCRVAPSMEEILRQAMATQGIELIDYGSYTAETKMPASVDGVIDGSQAVVSIKVYSKAYRERVERAAAQR